MASYPIEIRRCQHIKTSGAQCGSPAVKEQEFCYYHQQNRTTAAELYMDGERYADGQIMIPPFEDAHAIQMVLRHIVKLMLQRRIDRKDAGLALYALQIASGNLKQMQAEKPRPTQMVREPEKVAETPMGMTPWSASGEGHDSEEEEEEGEVQAPAAPEVKPAAPLTAEEMYRSLKPEERVEFRRKYFEDGTIKKEEYEDYFSNHGADPLLLAIIRLCGIRDRRQRAVEEAKAEAAGEAVLGTVVETGLAPFPSS